MPATPVNPFFITLPDDADVLIRTVPDELQQLQLRILANWFHTKYPERKLTRFLKVVISELSDPEHYNQVVFAAKEALDGERSPYSPIAAEELSEMERLVLWDVASRTAILNTIFEVDLIDSLELLPKNHRKNYRRVLWHLVYDAVWRHHLPIFDAVSMAEEICSDVHEHEREFWASYLAKLIEYNLKDPRLAMRAFVADNVRELSQHLRLEVLLDAPRQEQFFKGDDNDWPMPYQTVQEASLLGRPAILPFGRTPEELDELIYVINQQERSILSDPTQP